MIQDWKIKLEFIVSDGLKKIKKVTKEKKAMMKYLPGEGITKSSQFLRPAKAQILSDWNKEMKTAMGQTHKNLDKLGSDKIIESATRSKVLSLRNANVAVDTKKAVQSNEKQGSFQNLKLAIEQLQHYLKNTASTDSKSMYLPVYRPNMSNMALTPAKLTKWNKWYSVLNMMMDINELPLDNTCMMPKTEEDIMEVLKNFTVDQTSFNKTLEQWNKINDSAAKKAIKPKVELKQPRRGEMMKQPRRGSNALCRMKERKERKECAKQFKLCEFKNKAGSHYLVVRQRDQSSNIPIEVEDIFAEWNWGEEEKVKVKRVRKLSHRQQRKEIIKEAEQQNDDKKTKEHVGPLSYCDALKKNLKLKAQQPLIEEILESWAQYMKELNKMVENPFQKAEEVEDIFKAWKHNFVERKVRLVQRMEPSEEIFQMWQHNLKEPKDYYPTSVNVQKKEPKSIDKPLKIYQNKSKQNPPENTFHDWASKLILENTEESGRGEAKPAKTGPEEVFIDWLQQGCLQEPKPQRQAKVPTKMEEPEQTPITKRRLSKKQKNIELEDDVQTPTMKRKLSQKQKAKQSCPEEDNEFEGAKDSRRDDFAINQKIKNKKRNEASRRSGKLVHVE